MGKVLVFVTKKMNAEEVAKNLRLRDVELVLLHGDMVTRFWGLKIFSYNMKEMNRLPLFGRTFLLWWLLTLPVGYRAFLPKREFSAWIGYPRGSQCGQLRCSPRCRDVRSSNWSNRACRYDLLF